MQTHMNGRMLAKKVHRLGYYCFTMEGNCCVYVRRCHKCQVCASLQHQPPSFLLTLTSPWPFSIWGIDIIRKITTKGIGEHEYVLMAIDYSAKWVEVTSYAKITSKNVAKFLFNNIICKHGILHDLISDQGSHLERN